MSYMFRYYELWAIDSDFEVREYLRGQWRLLQLPIAQIAPC